MEPYYLNSPPGNSAEQLELLILGGISLRAVSLHGRWGEQTQSPAAGHKKVRNHQKGRRDKLSPKSCMPGTSSHAFKGQGGVARGGKWKGGVECIGMLGRAVPARNG